MEPRNINFFERLFYSITHFDFYQKVIKESSGKAVIYLLLLSVLLSLFSVIRPAVSFLNGVDVLAKAFKKSVPAFEFANGEFNIEGKMPMVIKEANNEVIIIDTSGQLDESALDQYESGVFISKNYAVNKKNSINSEKFSFTELSALKFNKQQVLGWVPYLKYFTIFIVITILIGTLIGKLISSLIVSIIGLIVNATIKSQLIYSEIYRAGVYAMTLPSIIKVCLGIIHITIPFFFIIYYTIICIYLVYAFTLIKESNLNSDTSQYPSDRFN